MHERSPIRLWLHSVGIILDQSIYVPYPVWGKWADEFLCVMR